MSAPSHCGPVAWPDGSVLPVSRTLPGLLEEMAAQDPEAPAVVAGQVRLSYADLSRRVRRAATALEGLGVCSGSRVALLSTNSAAWLEVAFGVLRRGARLDALNTWVRAYDLRHLLQTSAAEVLVMVPTAGSTDLLTELQQLLPALWQSAPGEWRSEDYPQLREVVLLDDVPHRPCGARSWDTSLAHLGDGSNGPGDLDLSRPHEVATVLYTSGSTRYPKAVPLVHSTMVENGFGIGERMGLQAADRVWLGSPLFWSFGVANAAMATMSHGACLVLQERFSPGEAGALLREERCTAAYLLPSITDALVAEAAEEVRALDHLRTGLTIGRPDEVRRVVEELGITGICNVYGSTETYGNCCVTPHTLPLEDRMVCQGEPLPGVEVRIIESVGDSVVPRGTAGEIHVRGHVMPGYLGDPTSTAAVMAEGGWYRTGDTGLMRADGRLQFIARHSEMIKTSGINVSPAEVESFLSEHPGIEDVAVVGAPHPTKGEVVVAFVSSHDATLSEGDVIDFCKGSIAGYKVPWSVILVDELPRTGTGKLARKQLSSLAAAAVEERSTQ